MFDKYVQMLKKLDKKLGFKGQKNEVDQEFIAEQASFLEMKKNQKAQELQSQVEQQHQAQNPHQRPTA